MSTPTENLTAVRLYLKTIEAGEFASMDQLFTRDMVIEQLPNRIYPQGIRSDLSRMKEAFEKGRKLLSSQTYEIRNQIAHGDSVAVEVSWTGTLAIPFGNLAAGAKMRAHSAMFFEFQDGKICSQRNYDCFEPW